MDGLVASSHEPMPGLIELKKVIQPVRLGIEGDKLLIENHYDFIDLGHLAATFELEEFDEE